MSQLLSISIQNNSIVLVKYRNVSKQDQGVYECQINTDPKINKKVYLQIEGDTRTNFFVSLFPMPNSHKFGPYRSLSFHFLSFVSFSLIF
jgi:hypothetical protein